MYQVCVQTQGQSPGDALARELREAQAERAAEAAADAALEAVDFSAGNPRVERLEGVVRLFRAVQGREEAEAAAAVTAAAAGPGAGAAPALPEERSALLAILAVPADVAVADLYAFFGAYLRALREVKFVRRGGGRAAQLVLLRFEAQAAADAFYRDLNDQPFSELEPDVLCRLVFVRSVQITGGTAGDAAALRELQAEPGGAAEGEGAGAVADPLGGAPAGQTELPSCPVCLERLDPHISGVTTTVCHHRFHNECLQRWGDTRCPVCRYCAAPGPATSRCAACATAEDLWICLICGHVGCGRYRAGHAADHWRSAGHAYALELETQRVWDYPSDAYVHRLIQSKADGKLVAVPSPPPPPRGPPSGDAPASSAHGGPDREDGGAEGRADPALEDALVQSKLDHLQTDYDHLIVTQMERQREYFEGLLSRAAAKEAAAAADLQEQVARAESAAAASAKDAAAARQTARNLESQLADKAAKLSKAEKERTDLRALNESLLCNQGAWREQVERSAALANEKSKAVEELQEQVRDLMFALEAGQTIAQAGGEAAGGSVMPVPAPPKPRRGARKKG